MSVTVPLCRMLGTFTSTPGIMLPPPFGFFVVLRSRRVTFCFLPLAGCFVFLGTLCFCFCGYDLLTGLVRTPKVTRRPPRTFSLGMRSSKRIAGFDRGGFGLAATADLLGGLGWSFMRGHFARAMPPGGRGERRRRIGTGRARPPNGQVPWIARACGGGVVARVAAKDILTDFLAGDRRAMLASFCGTCCRRMRPVASF